MKKLNLNDVTIAVKNLAIDACYNINDDVLNCLKCAKKNEVSELGKSVLEKIIENDELARRENLPMCQDTGVAVVFLEIGNQVIWDGNIEDAINQGIREAYTEG